LPRPLSQNKYGSCGSGSGSGILNEGKARPKTFTTEFFFTLKDRKSIFSLKNFLATWHEKVVKSQRFNGSLVVAGHARFCLEQNKIFSIFKKIKGLNFSPQAAQYPLPYVAVQARAN
jgi:hypothetical protein